MSSQNPTINRAASKRYYLTHRDEELARDQAKRQRAQEIIDQAKSVPCADCKQTFPPCVMDFDHIRGVKIADVSAMRGHSLERLLAEIAKCEVVCANCHRIRTNNRQRR